MDFGEDDVFFSDLKLDPDVHYFLYVGEIKTDCLNQFVKETLAKIHGQAFDFISVLRSWSLLNDKVFRTCFEQFVHIPDVVGKPS
ncbi:MAG TPA: hypothetical protein ENN39_06555 [Desulfonatronum sp.]|nr:hypothetical protein [Desulfonatronum sp.]